MESPEAALSGLIRAPGDFDEAVVEREVVSKRVLPALGVFPIVRKAVHDKLVYLAKWKHLLRAALDSHCGEGNVGVRRFLVAVCVSPGSRHAVQILCWNSAGSLSSSILLSRFCSLKSAESLPASSLLWCCELKKEEIVRFPSSQASLNGPDPLSLRLS